MKSDEDDDENLDDIEDDNDGDLGQLANTCHRATKGDKALFICQKWVSWET